MFKEILYILLFLFSFIGIPSLFAQEVISSENIADLKGAIEIERDGKYAIELSGNKGDVDDFKGSALDGKLKEKNTIFLIKHCLGTDELIFHLKFNKPNLQLAVFKFKYQKDKKKLDLSTMDLLYLSKELRSTYSNADDDEYRLPDFGCLKDDAFLIVINNVKSTTNRIEIDFSSNITDLASIIKSRTRIYDDRLPNDPTEIVLKTIDEENGVPVLCNINLISKKKNALYNASEVLLGEDAKTKLQIQCDAEGYFFKDTLLKLAGISSDTILIPMKSVSVGKIFKIDKIEFIRGTANIIPGATMILRRVKDFLILNSNIRIEIQGHVNNESDTGDKTSMKLSKLRAKTIRNYFIDSGINKDRMTIKGYGNSKPVYLSPKNEYEQQANRRVEIKIIYST